MRRIPVKTAMEALHDRKTQSSAKGMLTRCAERWTSAPTRSACRTLLDAWSAAGRLCSRSHLVFRRAGENLRPQSGLTQFHAEPTGESL
jgi:hypothetical protein